MRCFYTRWSDGLWEKEQQEVTVSQLGGLRKTWGKSWEPLMHGTEFDFEDSLRNSCKGRRVPAHFYTKSLSSTYITASSQVLIGQGDHYHCNL